MPFLLRNLYAGQEATARTRHGTTDWFQTGKGVCQGCILSPCLYNLYAEYITGNARLDEAQAGINREDIPALVSMADGGHGGPTDTRVVETGAAENQCVGGS